MLNKRTKSFLLFTTLLIVLVGIGAVAAADNSTATADTSSASTVQATTVAANTTTDTVQTSTDDSSSDVVKETTTTNNKDTQTNTATTTKKATATTTTAKTAVKTADASSATNITVTTSPDTVTTATPVTTTGVVTNATKSDSHPAAADVTNVTVDYGDVYGYNNVQALTTGSGYVADTGAYTAASHTYNFPGTYTITATYFNKTGSNFANAVNTTTITVTNPASAKNVNVTFATKGYEATTTTPPTLAASDLTVAYADGSAVTGITGTIYLYINDNTTSYAQYAVSNGVVEAGTGATAIATADNYTVKAIFISSNPSTVNSAKGNNTVLLNNVATATTVDVAATQTGTAADKYYTLTNTTITATLPAAVKKGTVTFSAINTADNSVTVLGTVTLDGTSNVATYTYNFTNAGNYSVVAKYVDITKEYATSSNNAKIEVLPVVVTVAPDNKVGTVFATTVLNATVQYTPNQAEATAQNVTSGIVSFYIPKDAENYTLLGTATVNNGVATLNYVFTTTGAKDVYYNYTSTGNTYANTTLTKETVTISSVATNIAFTNLDGQKVMDNTPLTATVTSVNTVNQGYVQFFVDGNSVGTANVASNKATLNYNFTTLGTHTITVVYSDSANTYADSTTTGTVVVTTLMGTTTTVTGITNSTKNGTVVYAHVVDANGLNVTSGYVTYNITYSNGTVLNTGTITKSPVNGTFTIPVAADNVTDTYNIKVTYSNDTQTYANSTATGSFTLTLTNTTVAAAANIQNATMNKSSITVNVKDSNDDDVTTGNVTVYYNGVILGNATVENGVATIKDISFENVGNYTLDVKYTDLSGIYAGSSNTTAANITYTGTTITATNPVTADTVNNATFTATVKDANGKLVNGTVTFYNGTTVLGTATAVDGIATLDYQFTTTGTVEVTANYTDSTTYANSTTTFKVNVGEVATNIVITGFTGNSTGKSTVTVKVTDAYNNPVTSGNVTVKLADGTIVGNATVNADGTATITGTIPSSQTITAVYNDTTGVYKNSTTSKTITINTNSTIVTVADVTSPALTKFAVTATVTDANGNVISSGSVTFVVNGQTVTANVVSGVATADVTGISPAGNYTITATYNAVSPYTSTVNSGIATITKIATTVNATDVTDVAYNNAAISATIKDANGVIVKSGTAYFYVNGEVVGNAAVSNGVATINYNFKVGGTSTITVKYNDTIGTYADSTGSATATIKSTGTTVTVTVPNDVTMNNTLITATVVDANNKAVTTGTVLFLDNGTIIGTATINATTGKANITYNFPTTTKDGNDLQNYTHTITAVYDDATGTYAGAAGVNSSVIKIGLMPTSINVTAMNVVTMNATTIVVNITDANGNPVTTGTANITINGQTVKAHVVDGIATFVMNVTGTGSENVLVQYGTNNTVYASSQNTTKFNVTKIGTTLVVNDVTGNTVTNTTLSATITDANGNPVQSGFVLFYNGTTLIGTASVANGVATTKYLFDTTGVYTITASYNDNVNNSYANVASATGKATIVNGKVVITAPDMNGTTMTEYLVEVNVTDANGNPITSGNITFKDSTSNITVPVVNGKANATTGYIEAGDYTVNVTYTDPNGVFTDANTTFVISIVKINTTVIVNPVTGTVGDTIVITANVTDDNGNPVLAGKVAFKVNGKTLVDANGSTVYGIVEDGVATINYTIPANWARDNTTITAVYSGISTTYNAARATVNSTVTVEKRTANMTVVTDTTAKGGDTITITAIVTDNSTVINGGKVVFKFQGKTILNANGTPMYAAVVNGLASINYTLPLGISAKDYNISAVFGNSAYNRADASTTLTVQKTNTTITVNPATGVSNATTTISGVIKDINGNNVVGTKKVAVKINGVTLKDAAGKVVYVYAQNGTINANVTLPSLSVGTHNLTFVTGDNSAYYGSTGVGTLVINKATATAKKVTA